MNKYQLFINDILANLSLGSSAYYNINDKLMKVLDSEAEDYTVDSIEIDLVSNIKEDKEMDIYNIEMTYECNNTANEMKLSYRGCVSSAVIDSIRRMY